MCFGVLTDGDALHRPVGQLLRAETRNALTQGVEVAAVVLAALLVAGVGLPLVAAATAVAVPAGALVHQVVVLLGVAVLRWRADGPDPGESVAG
jgi:hypothetical protein